MYWLNSYSNGWQAKCEGLGGNSILKNSIHLMDSHVILAFWNIVNLCLFEPLKWNHLFLNPNVKSNCNSQWKAVKLKPQVY